MNRVPEFNLDNQVHQWTQNVKLDPSIANVCGEELKIHILHMIEDLVENTGLNEEEAFIIATRRMGMPSDLENQYRQDGAEALNIRRTAVILAGVVVYFFFYHLTQALYSASFFVLNLLNVAPELSYEWATRILIAATFVFIIFFAAISLSERKVISYVERIHLKLKHIVWLLIATFFAGVTNVSLSPLVKVIIKGDDLLKQRFYSVYRIFDDAFPIMFCVGFLIVYLIYFKKAKI